MNSPLCPANLYHECTLFCRSPTLRKKKNEEIITYKGVLLHFSQSWGFSKHLKCNLLVSWCDIGNLEVIRVEQNPCIRELDFIYPNPYGIGGHCCWTSKFRAELGRSQQSGPPMWSASSSHDTQWWASPAHPSLWTVGLASVPVQWNCQHFAGFGTKANKSMRVGVGHFLWWFFTNMVQNLWNH